MIIKADKYVDPPQIPKEGWNLNDELEKSRYLKMCYERDKAITTRMLDAPKLYELIYQHLSIESIDMIKRLPDFEEIETTMDPLKLWLAVKKTHQMGSESYDANVQCDDAREAYQSMAQGKFEDNARYREFKADLKNDQLKRVEVPENLTDMYERAARFVIPAKSWSPGSGAAFVTSGEINRSDDNKKNDGKSQAHQDSGGQKKKKAAGEKKWTTVVNNQVMVVVKNVMLFVGTATRKVISETSAPSAISVMMKMMSVVLQWYALGVLFTPRGAVSSGTKYCWITRQISQFCTQGCSLDSNQ